MNTTDKIALGGVAATVLGSIISWFASAHVAKKNYAAPRLEYRLSLSPLLASNSAGAKDDLRVEYRGEWLPEPTLLSIDIKNIGEHAVENPPIEIKAVGATYVIPGYFEDLPPGYEDLWSIESTDAEACAIHLKHINKGQVAKVRLLLDEMPDEEPGFRCPMKDLVLRRVENFTISVTPIGFMKAAISGTEIAGIRISRTV